MPRISLPSLTSAVSKTKETLSDKVTPSKVTAASLSQFLNKPKETDPNASGTAEKISTMSASQVTDIQNAVSDPDNYLYNPLSDFEGVTYHWKLIMTNDLETAQALNSSTGTSDVSSSTVLNAIDNSSKVIIAESGVTSGFVIRDVRMEQVIGPSFQNRNTNTTQITMTIAEPMGTSFLEKIRNTASALQVKNLRKTFYYLELTFKGYNSKGENVNPAEKIGDQAIPNGGRWIYQVRIKNIDTQLDTSGSIYTLSCIPYNETGLEPEALYAPMLLTIQGNTIGEMLDDLSTKINEHNKMIYGTEEHLKIKYKTHSIRHGLYADEDPTSWTFKPNDIERESNRGLSFDSISMSTITIQEGTSLADVIEYLFANTEKGLNIAKDVARDDEINEDDGKSTRRKFRECVLFRIEPDLDITGYDPVTNNYNKSITFHVWAYATQAPILSSQQVSDASDGAIQFQMVNELYKKGFLRKKYDYFYTGLNTEVEKLDVQYNLAWDATLPLFEGKRASVEAVSNHALYSPDAINNARKAQAEARQISSEKSNLEKETKEFQSRVAAGENLTKEQYDENNQKLEKIAKLDVNLKNLVPVIQTGFKTGQQSQQNKSPSADFKTDNKYAEDFREEAQADDWSLGITFDYTNTQKQTGTGTTPLVGGGRGYLGAILDQLYGPITSSLINITMDIRGDPYWLGYSNLERKSHMSDAPPDLSPNANLPNTQEGDCTFLLNFDYPFDIDENTAEVFIRKDKTDTRVDTFHGVYRTTRVVHNFSDGMFTQTLTANRYPLVDMAKALGFKGGIDSIENPTSISTGLVGTAKGKLSAAANIGSSVAGTVKDKVSKTVAGIMNNSSKFTVANQVYNSFRGSGFSHEQSLGAVANAIAESSLDPKANVLDSNGYRSYGLFQLNGNGAGKGQSVANMLTTTGNTNIIKTVAQSASNYKSSTTPSQAAVNFMLEVERPKDPDGSKARERAAIADALTKYKLGN